MIGQTFGHWSILAVRKTRNSTPYWLCRCTCGVEREVNGNNMRKGLSTSCGKCSRIGAESATFKHGKTHTDLHNIWLGMKNRCNNPKTGAYRYYGGRGIKVCDRWQNDFSAFEADMGPRPPGLTVERVDNDGPYAPWNCKWATRAEQNKNQRSKAVMGALRKMHAERRAREEALS